MFTLQYLDDAIYLTRRSQEVQPPDRSAWHQYFTLGEIFKAYGHYQNDVRGGSWRILLITQYQL
ncbi:Uncharacterized protein OBRU01_13207 [Operophtera brumata]|uniref:Uncharacterized protein n=1 Tax=Operophtera brumata TaxID=104452 RepID=A0A0L7L8W2_OPEBR|nr:Uncharacterized protein OBRU01_13207 [Operophtera brumata]